MNWVRINDWTWAKPTPGNLQDNTYFQPKRVHEARRRNIPDDRTGESTRMWLARHDVCAR
jgi:hypothetical protein